MMGYPSKAAAALFAALADETRLSLVVRLGREGRRSITHLTAGTSVTRQAITRHLRVLAEAGLVRGYRSGREQLWEIEEPGLAEARRYLQEIGGGGDSDLERPRSLAENPAQVPGSVLDSWAL